MRARGLVALLGALLVALPVALPLRRAHAQAPGQLPVQVPPPLESHRWGIGLGAGWTSFQPNIDGADRVPFGTLELQGRFRFRPDMEVDLMLGGGGALKGDFSTGGIFADYRYRFMAQSPLNVYVLAGLGIVSAAAKDASSDETKGRGALRVGVGVEQRFGQLALAAELRLLGVAENADLVMGSPGTTSYQLARYGLSGSSFVLGGAYYF